MDLVFELSATGRSTNLLPASDVEIKKCCAKYARKSKASLPEVAESELARHFSRLAKETFGVCDGFYPLGSCTMKYNPRINEEIANMEGFTGIHPLQDESTVQGCLETMHKCGEYLSEITGMDNVSLQPAAGAHGEYLGVLLIKAYHQENGDTERTKIIIPDAAHGTNPATAAMAGMDIINVPSNEKGCVDLDALRNAVGSDTAGLMLTNPNTVGLFDPNILEICNIVHEAGGLCYYDGANLNAIMGVVRPGDMGFDCVHLNLHKTFATPHGGGGPGCGAVGCKAHLSKFLPDPMVERCDDGTFKFVRPQSSIGKIKSFYGNYSVVLKTLAYIMTLGSEGIKQAAEVAVLNANYLMNKLKDDFDIAFEGPCMHEFVMTLSNLKQQTGASALDVAKRFLDFGMHPPTMYFPLVVNEALMIEPTETETVETLNLAADTFKRIKAEAVCGEIDLHKAPFSTRVGRPDEVGAARNPILKYTG